MFILSPVFISLSFAISACFLYIVYVGTENLMATYFLVIFLLCLQVSSIVWCVCNKSSRKGRGVNLTGSLENRLYKPCLVLFIGVVAGVGVLVELARASGYVSVFEMAGYYSAMRYNDGLGIPALVKVFNVFLYFSSVVSFLVFFDRMYSHKKGKLKFLIPGFFLVVEAFLLGTKSIVVLVAIYGMLSWRYSGLYHKAFDGFRIKIVAKILLFLLLIVAAVVVIHYVRSGGRADIYALVVRIFTSYLYVPFFSMIELVSSEASFFSLDYMTFMGFFAYVDDDIVKQQAVYYFDIQGVELRTNVYTAYYYLVNDVGLVPLLFVLVLICAALLYIELFQYRGVILFFPLYIVLSTYIMFAFADPVFKYMTNILFFVALTSYCLFSYIMKRKRRCYEY